MQMLAYGVAVHCVDEYLKIGASTTMECMKIFTLGVVEGVVLEKIKSS